MQSKHFIIVPLFGYHFVAKSNRLHKYSNHWISQNSNSMHSVHLLLWRQKVIQ